MAWAVAALMEKVDAARRATPAAITLDARELEREQVARAMRGDALAFRALVERHHRGMYGLALRLLGAPADAEDAVQEAFARAYCRLDRYDASYRLSTWLYRIVLNVCRDAQRGPRARERLSAEPDPGDAQAAAGPAPEAQLAERERSDRVRAALAQLRPAYREILVLKDVQELSYEEIKAITGTPITALKIRAIRARSRLRKLLEQEPS